MTLPTPENLAKYTVDPLGLGDWRHVAQMRDWAWLEALIEHPVGEQRNFKLWFPSFFGSYARLQFDGSTFLGLRERVTGVARQARVRALEQIAATIGSSSSAFAGYYFPYLTNVHAPDDMGHVDFPVRDPEANFCVTGSMNGCALVVTEAPAGGGRISRTHLRVYHYPSPGSHASFLSKARRDRYQWTTRVPLVDSPVCSIFLDQLISWKHWWGFYDYAGRRHDPRRFFGESESPCALNMLYWDGETWRLLSQNQKLRPDVTHKYKGKSVGLTLERTGLLQRAKLRDLPSRPRWVEAYLHGDIPRSKWLQDMAYHLIYERGWDRESVTRRYEEEYLALK
ncbi:hypothetical protein G6O69_06085 [Pseudenhygromyxa sp. WMMC2535]|uniref:hypothetical protein n=1 Tax=Pseudenhygromyxa sp. WMMC2535 TaxID=2712867 RepID=UPI00155485BA|nr:hypothetical protein [Pseudenhygromyxa sp. WMMC2535]NVB37393.1 hypothetical protein [Pseudenhygromyxa sp. WMMC2535]